MKNIAVIFAGGSGKRMNTVSRPKQFLELNGKPVMIYTLELFDNHPMIDGIVVVCIEPWIPFLEKQLKKFDKGGIAYYWLYYSWLIRGIIRKYAVLYGFYK